MMKKKKKNDHIVDQVSGSAYGTAASERELTLWEKILPPAVLSILTLIIYAPSLSYPFQFDDIANITKKFAIRFDNPLGRWWTNSRWFGDWLNTLNFQIGRFDPFSYRLFNVLIHVATGVFVFFLVLSLSRKIKGFLHDNALLIATTTSALFLLHPVQSQTVSYVIQARIEGLATLFIVATVTLFVQAFTTKSQIQKWSFLALSLIIGFFSCGTKEIVIVLPFLLLITDWFFVAQQKWSSFKTRLWVHALFTVFIIGLMMHYLGVGFAKQVVSLDTATTNNRGNVLTVEPLDDITPYMFFISEFKVILHYIFIFLMPIGISVEYDWKLVKGFLAIDALFPFLALLALGLYVLWATIKKRHTFMAFGITWFLIALAPRSTFFPSPELVCDYKTYLASIGVLFIMSVGLIYVLNKLCAFIRSAYFFKQFAQKSYAREAHVYFVLLALVSVPYGVGTVLRNQIWRSAVDFWEDNAKKAPGKARVHNNLGVAYSEVEKLDEAIVAYKKAISMDRHYQDPLSNIAVAYSMKGEIDKAIESLRAAIQICPNYAEAYNNIGSLLLQKEEFEDAERALTFALYLRPYYGKAHYNLARMYEVKNNEEKMWHHLKQATLGDLDVPEVFFKLGLMGLKLQKYDEAVKALETTWARGMQNEQVLFNLANAYFMVNQFDKAESIFLRLVKSNPLDKRYVYNLAETHFSKADYDKALNLFKKSTTFSDPLPQAFFRVAKCFEMLKQEDHAKGYLNELLTLKSDDNFKNAVNTELARLSLQEKMIEGNGSVKLSDFKTAVKQMSTSVA
ncbi:tetratricopeptide repeat protein [bacterium]|nr:MAG: tetratricopeptide repeat protein [bacterium]